MPTSIEEQPNQHRLGQTHFGAVNIRAGNEDRSFSLML